MIRPSLTILLARFAPHLLMLTIFLSILGAVNANRRIMFENTLACLHTAWETPVNTGRTKFQNIASSEMST